MALFIILLCCSAIPPFCFLFINCSSCWVNVWDVSRVLLEKIEGPSYLQNKEKQNAYLVKHPYVAKKLNINIVSVEKKGSFIYLH